MRRRSFTAAIVLATVVPVAVVLVALSSRTVRATLAAFVSPLPAATVSSAGPSVAALPPQVVLTGAESSELHALAAGDAGTPTYRGARTKLFPPEPPVSHDAYEGPRGVRRSELAARDNPSTEHAVQYLATDARGHGALLAAIKMSGRHRDEVERILRAWKLPPELSAVAFVESGFVPTSTAVDGGVGLWSLAPEVSRSYGIALLDKYDERRAVAVSTEAAAHYLADLHERFGSWELALFANAIGYPAAVQALSNRSSLDYWDLVGELPQEGTYYVSQVLAVATMLNNPVLFGLDGVRPDPPEVTSDLEVPGGATFNAVARAAGTSAEHLHELNPEYLGETVPNTGFVMVMHLPSAGLARAKELLMPLLYSTSGTLGRDSTFDWGKGHRGPGDGGDSAEAGGSAASASVSGPPGSRRLFYRVQDGDTLESVSRRFGLPREAIVSDNSLDPSAGLRAGQLLLLRLAADGGSPH